jgi:uncharacterized protein (TIGR02646 family)
MIFVNRTAKPKILENNAANWTKDYLDARAAVAADPSTVNKDIASAIEKRYNKTEVKDALKGMFKHKCAFCESKITHVDYGQIEHFKPKSVYPDLCFEWNNFLLSCSICNGKSNKGDKFPLEAKGGPFINPTVENPDDFFRFEYDNVLNKFIVFPKNERAKTMLGIIKLNREELLEHRTEVLLKILYYVDNIVKKNPDALEEFKNLFNGEEEYFSFIRLIITKAEQSI